MKLGVIPSLVLLVLSIYISIPSESNIVLTFIDNICTNQNLAVTGACDIVPMLKAMVTIIGVIGAIASLLQLIKQMFKGQWFFENEKVQR